jgi:hypothetical protein
MPAAIAAGDDRIHVSLLSEVMWVAWDLRSEASYPPTGDL